MARFQHEIKWALLFTGMMLIWMTLEKMAGLHGEHIDKHPIYTNLVAIPAILLYVFALREKKKILGERITYKQAFVSGFFVSLFIALLAPLSQYFTITYITPDFFPNAQKYAVENGLMTEEGAANYFNLKSYMVQSAVGALIMGVVTTAIAALFIRTKTRI
jgi:hypothetical protein